MDTSNWSSRQGHRLLQLGMLVFLIALLVGLAVPKFAVPRLGLSAHLIGIMQGLFLMVSGLLRPVDNPVLQLVRCAEEVLVRIPNGPAGWQLRIGIHVGPVVAGTLGESQ